MADVDVHRKVQRLSAADRERILGLGDIALHAETAQEFAQRVVSLLHDLLSAECVEILDGYSTTSGIRMLAGTGWSKHLDASEADASRIRFVTAVLHDYEPSVVLQHRVEDLSGEPQYLCEEGIECGICVPIAACRTVYGVIGVYARQQRSYLPNEIAIIQFSAMMLAQFIRRLRTRLPQKRHGDDVPTSAHVDGGTERDALVAEADLLHRQLARMNRIGLLGQMSAGIAHELHQPLTAIANYAAGALALIDRHGDEASIRKALNHVTDLTFRTSETIRRMRTLVCASDVHRTSASLNQLIHEVAELVRPETRMKSIALSFTIDQSLPLVSVDTVQIQQVILNLLRNAIDAVVAQPGERAIHVATTHDDETIELAVTDTGRGCDVDDVQKFFEPFYTSKQGGTGMGLSICRSIITAHGGAIDAERVTPTGLRFRVRLPRSGED